MKIHNCKLNSVMSYAALALGSMATLCAVPHLYANIGYDPVKDFAPVTIIAASPFVLDVHPSVPARITTPVRVVRAGCTTRA